MSVVRRLGRWRTAIFGWMLKVLPLRLLARGTARIPAQALVTYSDLYSAPATYSPCCYRQQAK